MEFIKIMEWHLKKKMILVDIFSSDIFIIPRHSWPSMYFGLEMSNKPRVTRVSHTCPSPHFKVAKIDVVYNIVNITT